MPYTAEEIGARVKAAKPELADFPDKDVGDRILAAHPELAGVGASAPAAAPMASSHAPVDAGPVAMAPSHMPGTGQPGPMQAPAIDPLTGRQQTAGRTMSEAETAKYRTGALATTGAVVGSMGLGAAVAPVLAFARTTPASAFAIQGAARILGAAIGGAGGESYGQLFEHAHGVGPSSSSEAASRIGETAKDQAELEGLGLGIEGASKLVAGAVKGMAGKTIEALRKTSVYDKMVAAKAAAATERNLAVVRTAADTADSIANDFAQPPIPGLMEMRGPGIVKAAEEKVAKNVSTMYEGFKQAVSNKIVDYRDVADMIVKLERDTPRAKGGLRVMTEPDPAWANFVEAMKSGNVREAVPQVVGGKTVTTMAPARNSIEAAPAVVDARGTISQRIADLERGANPPREYIAGLKNSLAALDTKLQGVAAEVGPGAPELLTAAKQYYGASREIQKQGMYKLLKNGGDVARALMDPGAPEGVAVLKSVARETGDATIVPTAQRAVIEKLLNPNGKGIDILRFNDRLNALSLTGEQLFADPKASRVISGIKEQADVINRLETIPRINGKSGEKMAIELLTHALGSVAGYEIGKDLAPGAHGGWVGAAVGGSMSGKAVGAMLRLAENPAANKMFLGALKGIEKTGEVTGVAAAQAARALNMVKKMQPLGEKQEARNAAPVR